MQNLKLNIRLNQLDLLTKMYSKHLVSVEYINTVLHLEGKVITDITKASELYELDQDHFLGIDATNECIKSVNISEEDLILDIGSGFGGPARFIADKTGARVIGIEIQSDRFHFSKQITSAVGLSNNVDFILGDFNKLKLFNDRYSKVISFLTILHIINKKSVFNRISKVLKQNGMIYIEDYYCTHNLNDYEQEKLLNTISCPNLLLKNDYLFELEKNGITVMSYTDMTDEWALKAYSRFQTMTESIVENKKIYGINKALDALEFSKGVFELFSENIIRGFRIVGKKR